MVVNWLQLHPGSKVIQMKQRRDIILFFLNFGLRRCPGCGVVPVGIILIALDRNGPIRILLSENTLFFYCFNLVINFQLKECCSPIICDRGFKVLTIILIFALRIIIIFIIILLHLFLLGETFSGFPGIRHLLIIPWNHAPFTLFISPPLARTFVYKALERIDIHSFLHFRWILILSQDRCSRHDLRLWRCRHIFFVVCFHRESLELILINNEHMWPVRDLKLILIYFCHIFFGAPSTNITKAPKAISWFSLRMWINSHIWWLSTLLSN